MAIIPISSAPRTAENARELLRKQEEEEDRAYRQRADAKLRELKNQPKIEFKPERGRVMIDIPEPLPPGGWRMNAPGVETPDTGRISETSPDWDQGDLPMGTGGPENPVPGGLSDQDLIDIRERRAQRQADEEARGVREMILRAPDPDAAARAQDLSAKHGVNRLDVEQNLQSYESADEARGIDDLRKKAPKLRGWLATPENFEVARDDTQTLSWWEDIQRSLEAGFERTARLKAERGSREGAGLGALTDLPLNPETLRPDVPTGKQVAEFGYHSPGALASGTAYLASGFWGLLRIPSDLNDQFVEWITGRPQESIVSEFTGRMQTSAATASEDWMPEVEDPTVSGALQGVRSLPASAAAVGVTMATGGGGLLAATSLGAVTGGAEYGEARSQGMSPTGAAGYGFTQGSIEAATELLPMKWLVGDLAKKTPFVEMLFRQAFAEAPTEQVATHAQDFVSWAVLPENADKTINDYLAARGDAAYQTLIAALVGSGVQTTVAKGIDATLQAVDESYRQRRSEQLAKTFEAMRENAKDSKLLKRLPEKYREFVNEATRDGPLEAVRVAPEAITELAQSAGVTTDQLAQAFRIDPADIVQAVEAGEDVVIPAGNWAAALQTAKKEIGVSGETIYAGLKDSMRLRPDDLTAREFAAYQQTIEQEAEARKQWDEKENAFASGIDRVGADILQQVRGTGLFNEDAAFNQAELVTSMVSTLALRTGMDPEVLWKEQGFDVVTALKGEEDVDPVALAQTVIDELAIPVGFIAGKDKAGNRQKFAPRDIVLGYNDGDTALDMALDLELSEDINQRERVKNLVFHTRMSVRRAKELGQIERLAERWGVTPDELERFAEPRAQGGGFEDLMGDVVDIVERDNRNGHAPGLAQVVERLAARGRTISADTLKVSLSHARTGNGRHRLSDAMRERVKALQFAKGRGAAQGKALAQDARGTFTPRADRSIVRLFESSNLSTLAHEASHWYLDTLWRMSQVESPHPFVLEQMAAILEWQGKHPEWNAMFNPDGSFTAEGRDIQEAFAETFEAYLMDGKAPTVGLRSVFAAFKQWLLNIYKGIVSRIGGRVRLNDEIRAVFDRMLATDEAIKAAQTGLARDSEAMAKALLDKGVITEKQLERTKERIAAARERAEAALMARLMDEYERSRKSAWNDEERQVRREVQSEIDERPEQRAYQVLSGKGWKDTREAHAEAAFAEAEAMLALAQEEGLFESDASDDALKVMQQRAKEAGLGPLIMLFRTSSGRIIAFPGADVNMSHDVARRVFGLGDLKLDHGVYLPQKWPTIAAMNASDASITNKAWYATTGTEADVGARALAQRTYSAERHREEVKKAFAYLQANPEAARGPLSAIMEAAETNAYAADRARRLYRKGGALAQSDSLIVYRGSADDVVGEVETGRLGSGLYSAEDPEIGAEWGGATGKVDAWRINGRLFDLDEATAQGIENYQSQENTEAGQALIDRLKAEGYVGIRDPWSGHINVFVESAMERYPQGDMELGATWTNDDEMSLAQTVQPSRQLDALGFYSAAQESALRVPDNIWKMGWQPARNSLAKGHQGIVPRKTELEWLSLDAVFAGTLLKGEQLKQAVLEHIEAQRLSLTHDWARYDPNVKAPPKAQMLEEIDDDTLATMLGVVEIHIGRREGRIDATELDGAEPLWTGLGVKFREDLSREPGRRYYDLHRVKDGGKLEVLATDVMGNLLGKAARIIFNEHKSRAMRRLSADEVRAGWEESRIVGMERNLVRGPGDIRLPGEGVPLFEMVIALPPGVPGSDYRAPFSHVGGKMQGTLVAAHGEERIDDKGQRSVFVGQVQSDMAQQAREDKADAPHHLAVIKLLAENPDAQWFGIDAQGEYRPSLESDSQRDLISRGTLERGVADFSRVADVPLLKTSEWTNVAVRAMIYRAARDGFQSISFPTAETSEIIQGNDSAAQHYETNVKGALEKIGRQLGGEVRRGAVDYIDDGGIPVLKTRASAYILDITPEMRAKIVAEGFPLFQEDNKPGTTTQPSSIPPMRLNLQAVREQYGEQALAEIPPEVAAYSAQATDLDQFVDIARSTRKTLKEKKPKTLWKFLSTNRNIGSGNDRISYRGIQDTGGELIQMIGEKKAAPGLIADKEQDGKRVRSYTLEHAAHAAWEEGYFQDQNPPSPEAFLEALRNDLEGRAPLYAADDMATVRDIENAEQWAEWFEANDVDIRAPVAELREKLAVVITSTAENAIGPDEAAPFFKMQDGRALLEGLKQGPLRNKLIRDETNKRMIARHGDVFRDGTIMAEAQAYARNEIQHRQFEIELEALAQATGQQAAGKLARQQAIENLRTKQVREVLNYQQWLTLERRWAQKALKAAAAGKMAEAQEYARYRLINSHMYSEGKKLAEKIEKTRKHLLRYDAKTALARLHAAGRDYAEQMQGLLSDYQLRNESRKAEDRRASRAVWLQTQMTGIDPYAAYADPTKSAQEQMAAAQEAIERSALLAQLAEGVEARNYKSITVEEFLAVRDEADLIYRLATLKDRLIKEGERRRLSLAADDIAAEVEANQPNEKPPEPIETDTPGEKQKFGPKKYFAMHRTLQSLAHQFAGGKEGGVFWRLIVRPLNEAFSRLTTIRKQMGEDIAGLFGAYTKAEQERFYRDRRRFNGIGRSLTTQGRLAIALNWGNLKNRQRIMDAYGWDEAQVQEVLDSLDKRDWDFVQATWDYLDTWFPEANRVHQSVHGVPMTKEDAAPIATRFGVYKGGYYPIKFDPMLSSKAGQRAVEAESRGQTRRVGVRTKEGFTKKRVSGKVTMPLRLSALDVISQHLDEVAKSVATEETLFDVGRILKQKQVEDAIVSRHGRITYNTIIDQVVTAKFGMEGTNGILAHLRNGATVVGLSWKVATAALQVLGVSNSVVRVGGPWVAMGYGRMAKGAIPIYQAAKEAMQKSEFMRHRRQQQSPEMASLLDAIKNKWTPGFVARVVPRELRAAHNFMVRNGFALMANVQFGAVDVPTWWGAYYKARHYGAEEADAIAMADQAVVDAQGGGEIHQLAAMQSGAGTRYAALLRILTNFMSYMVTTYNLGIQRVRNARTPAQIAALAFDMILLAAVPVAGKMLLDLITRGMGEGDEPEEWAERYMREQVAFVLGPFVGVSQFAGAARGDDSYGYKGPAGLAIFNEMNRLGSALAEGDFDDSFWKPANRAAGMIFHYPAGQVDASVRGALAYFNGETDNPAAFFFGPPPAN